MSSVEASVAAKVSSLRSSFISGRNKSLHSRIKNLEDLRTVLVSGKQKLIDALSHDLHKSATESYYTEMNLVEHEIQHMVDDLHIHMSPKRVGTDLLNIGGSSYIYPDPLGVVCVIGAWNYPVQLSLAPMVGALAAGNTVLLKVPSDQYTPATSKALAELLAEHMDPGVVQVVEGAREATGAVLKQRFDKIFFTGGSFVGKMVAKAAAEHLCPCVLELGGKSPVFVTSSADVAIAARRIAWGAFMNSGQTCVRPDYCLVDESVAARFIQELVKCVEKMYGEHESREIKRSEFFGRLINERAFDRVADILARTDAGFVKFGGASGSDRKSKFVHPTIVDFGDDYEAFDKSAVMEDELFSPILPIYRYKSLDEAIGYVNGREKPLSCYLFSTDAATTSNILSNTTAGSSNVNDVMMHMCNPELPFGGVGYSGMGRYHGKYSFDCFTHFKSVLFKQNIGDLWVRYPPYTKDKVFVLSVFQKTRPGWIADVFKWLLILGFVYAMRKTGWVGTYAHEIVKLVLEE